MVKVCFLHRIWLYYRSYVLRFPQWKADSMSRKLQVAVVGCGGMMGKLHLEAYQALKEDAEIVALCDTREEILAEVGQAFPKATRFTNWRQLIAPGTIDLLSVCTFADTHCEITVEALEAGAHVMCEKPFAMNLTQADCMLETAVRTNRLIQVGTNMRHMRQAAILRDLVASGTLGRPMLTRGWTLHGQVPWWGPHYIKRHSSGGALASMLVHIIDAILFVGGSPDPISISASAYTLFPNKRRATAPDDEAAASYDVDDLLGAHVRLSDGSSLILQSSWVYDGGDALFNFEMMCEKGTVSLTPLSIVIDDSETGVDRTIDYAGADNHSSWGDSINEEIAHFVRAIRDGTEPSQSQREIRNVQVIQDGLYESTRCGREVRVNEKSWS